MLLPCNADHSPAAAPAASVNASKTAVTAKVPCHEPMTCAIRDEQVYVFDRNGIWRLRDTNHDGEADVHELFSNAFAQTADMREFPSTLRLAPGGEFIIAKGGQEATTLGKPTLWYGDMFYSGAEAFMADLEPTFAAFNDGVSSSEYVFPSRRLEFQDKSMSSRAGSCRA